MKKILLLGGSAQQIVAIETAKRLGYYTVLCDYLQNNPGQHHADKFYLVSTTDRDAVLKVAQIENVDGVLAYASDPAAPTAAYVAEKMGLPGSPLESVEILCEKDRFRRFLRDHGFCTPFAKGYGTVDSAIADISAGAFRLPALVKPVDSSGSKGVQILASDEDVREKLDAAMIRSRCGRIIVEEFVEKFGYQVAGDGFSVNGRLLFRCFGNDHFDPSCPNPFVPVSASFPYNMPAHVHDRIHGEIQRLIDLLNIKTTAYNFDIRIDADLNVYLMEVAPRSGGNYIPQVIKHGTGVDLTELAVLGAMGETVNIPQMPKMSGFWSYFAVHSAESGILERIEIADEARGCIIEDHITANPGDAVTAFTGANTTLGILIMEFDSMEHMLRMMDHPDDWIRVVLR